MPSEENAAVIADFFPEVTQEQVLDSLRGMVFYLDLLGGAFGSETLGDLHRPGAWQVSLRSWRAGGRP